MMKKEVIDEEQFQKSSMKYIAYLAENDKQSEFKENVFEYLSANLKLFLLE
jgi:hypothetical protein